MDPLYLWLLGVSGLGLAAGWVVYKARARSDARRKTKRLRVEAQRAAAEATERERTLRDAAADEAARVDAQRLAADERRRLEAASFAAARVAAEAGVRAEVDRLDAARESAVEARSEAVRAAARAAARAEVARNIAEETARVEAVRQAAAEAARAQAARAEDEAARAASAQRAAALAARADAERRTAADEAARAAAAADAAVRAKDEQATSAVPTLRTPRAIPKTPEQTLVLVADDSKIVRVKTGRLLERHRYRVAYAIDGCDAAEQVLASVPDVVITDVEMPRMDGFELTRQLRRNPLTANVPVIMITAANDKHRDDANRAGVSVLLGKPYPEEELIAYIRSAMQPTDAHAGALA